MAKGKAAVVAKGKAAAKKATTADSNPLLGAWTTPFEMPPFDKVRIEHFMPAFDKAFAANRKEIAAIASAEDAPTFANTIDALEKSGDLLDRTSSVFFNLAATDTNKDIQAIERALAPRFAKHGMRIYQDETLFARVDALFKKRKKLGLSEEQGRVLERYHRAFVKSGAGLDAKKKKRMAAIAARMSVLGTRFSQNLLADEQAFVMVLEGERDIAGLPESVRAAAAQAAKDHGHPGKHVVTLARSSIEPFLQYSARRDLREKAFRAWAQRGANGGETDNRKIVAEILGLRAERAHILGFKTAANSALEFSMAKTPATVRKLLMEVWAPARVRAGEERDQLQEAARAEGGNFKLAAWDWRYYAEKVRKARYDVDDGEIKPYLQLDNVIAAAFDVAGKLFGIEIKERKDLPVYHPDVRVFEVMRQGKPIGLFLGDYFARPSKHSGAWMSGWRKQEKLAGQIRPIVVNVMNFAKGAAGEPTLLSLDDARTLFHEFGHGLHGLLSNVTYPSVSGTSVEKDFVELPSQLYEHWLLRPEVMSRYARHYKTWQAGAGGTVEAAGGGAQLQPGLQDHRVPVGGDRRPRPARDREGQGARRRQIRGGDALAHRHARGDRHAPPHPALPAHHGRLCGGLLQLSVVGGDGRRRVPGLRGGGRHLRRQAGQAALRQHLLGRRQARCGGRLQGLPRPAAGDQGAAREARAGRGVSGAGQPTGGLMGAALEHHRAGRLAEAERAYEAVLDAEPTNVDALNLLGVIKGQKGDLAAAERLIGAALRRAPNAPLVILNYGNVLNFMGRYAEAVAHFDQVLAAMPTNAQAWNNRGHALRALGRLEEALESFERLLRLAPDLADAWFAHGNVLFALRRLPQALESYSRAVTLRPRFPEALTMQALVLAQRFESQQALAAVERALSFAPKLASARFVQALAALPQAAVSEEEAAAAGALFAQRIDGLRTDCMDEAHAWINALPLFGLTYQERNNRGEFAKYGALCSDAMALWHRQHHAPTGAAAPARTARVPGSSGAPVRLGIASSFVWGHSVWHAILRGVVEHIDRAKIELHIFHLGKLEDARDGVGAVAVQVLQRGPPVGGGLDRCHPGARARRAVLPGGVRRPRRPQAREPAPRGQADHHLGPPAHDGPAHDGLLLLGRRLRAGRCAGPLHGAADPPAAARLLPEARCGRAPAGSISRRSASPGMLQSCCRRARPTNTRRSTTGCFPRSPVAWGAAPSSSSITSRWARSAGSSGRGWMRRSGRAACASTTTRG